ncbi:PREDICTED: uncharacterized protein LOC109192999 [Ipomoea nil]|uniref:uncharacterized protein LOC109192999 n=1 Tax=Ipomoea nil TaxID=35883 RepID=UPI000901DA94|nr:PREDICTED: uncharacterized protein LOC109192999 [Ipomoea nil]
MVSCPVLAGSKVLPFGVFLPNGNSVSFRHCHKHLEGTFPAKNLHSNACFKLSKTYLSSSLSLRRPSERFSFLPLKCSGSHSSAKSDDGNVFGNSLRNLSVESIKSNISELTPFLNSMRNHSVESIKSSFSQLALFLESLKNHSGELIKSNFSQLTPFDLCKWSVVIAIAIAVPKWIVSAVFNPFFWMYFSWTWLFWPWMAAIVIAVYGFYCLNKHLRGDANVFEQLAIVTSAFTWLTLVPPAHFNGFLEGWPFVFFFVYHYFFFFNVSVRKRLYGDFFPREHDPKWDISLPNWQKLLFGAGVTVGHWIAAFEGPELHLIPGGWSNAGVWGLIIMTLFMQYHSTLYLANYSEKVVVPTAVVQFGPYRFVRHPIYASTMLLFATYCIALRAPLSTLFTVAVCLVYYGQKAELEEVLMVETFGERYLEYSRKVKYRFLPFVY